VIMILTDDLGFADTSLYGGSIDTPNMLLTRAGTGPAGTTAQLRLNGYRTGLVTGSDQVRLSRLDAALRRWLPAAPCPRRSRPAPLTGCEPFTPAAGSRCTSMGRRC